MLSRRYWVACAAILAATPLSAQDYVWTGSRPDAAPPAGIVADRVLPAGAVELRYIFSNTSFEGRIPVIVEWKSTPEFGEISTVSLVPRCLGMIRWVI